MHNESKTRKIKVQVVVEQVGLGGKRYYPGCVSNGQEVYSHSGLDFFFNGFTL